MATRPVKKPGTKRKSPVPHKRGDLSPYKRVGILVDHEATQLSRYGVYAYTRKSDGKVMYIGKDSTIHEKNRKAHHENPDNKSKQVVNTNLLEDINAYEYSVIAICANKDWMEDMETSLIGAFKGSGECEWNVENTLPQEVVND